MTNLIAAYQANKEKWNGYLFYIWVVSFFMFAAIIGLESSRYVDFIPMDGEMQTYNGIRRLLDGQVPFEDFVHYLGLGTLYFFTFFVSLANNFAFFKFILNFLSFASFGLGLFVMMRLFKIEKSVAIITATLFCLGVVILNYFVEPFSMKGDLAALIRPENSIRIIRMLVIFPTAILFSKIVESDLSKCKKTLSYAALSAFSIVWCNDFGVSSFLTISVIYTLFLCPRDKTFFSYMLSYLGATFVITFLLASLATFGNFNGWFEYNFISVAQEQFYYYGLQGQKFSDIGSFMSLVFDKFSYCAIAAISAYLIYDIYSTKVTPLKISVLYFLASSFGGFALYYFASGSNHLGYVVNYVAMILMISVFVKVIWKFEFLKEKKFVAAKLILTILFLLSVVGGLVYSVIYEDKEMITLEVPALNGKISDEMLRETLREISPKVTNKKFFSLYSTALEIMNDKYNVTGSDYIIHALGQKNRDQYLERFLEFNPDVVLTPPTYQSYSYAAWIKRANWWFYKTLIENYEINNVHGHLYYWGKSAKPNILPKNSYEAKIKVEKILPYVSKITIELDDKNVDLSNYSLIADVNLSYESQRNTFSDIVKYRVTVGDIFGSYGIPNSSKSWNVGVTLNKNNKGFIIIRTPRDQTNLNIKSATIGDILIDFKKDKCQKTNNITDVTHDYFYEGFSKEKDDVIIFKSGLCDEMFKHKTIFFGKDKNNSAKIIKMRRDKLYTKIAIDKQLKGDHKSFTIMGDL